MTRKLLHLVVDFAVLLAIVVALPLGFLLAFAVRGAFTIALPLLLVAAAVAYYLSPSCREALRAWSNSMIRYKGLRLDTQVGLHPSHSWARMNGEVCVGADDLVQATLGPVDQVDLPTRGTHVAQGEPLFSLRHANRTVTIASPVSGTVLSVNPELRTHPELVNSEPFNHGWAVRLHSDNPRVDRGALLRGRQARTWFRWSAERILSMLPPRPDAGPEADVCAEQLHRALDDSAWDQINKGMFAPTVGHSTPPTRVQATQRTEP